MSDVEDGRYSPLTSRWADETTPLLSTAQIPDYEEHVVTQQLHAEPDDFPEGGFRAWSVVFGSWCAMIAAFGLMNSMGVIHAWLSNHQLSDHSYANIGWIFSTYTFFVYFGSVQIGECDAFSYAGPLTDHLCGRPHVRYVWPEIHINTRMRGPCCFRIPVQPLSRFVQPLSMY